MDLKLIGNRLLVRPDGIVDQTKSGIILSDYTKKRPPTGTIVAVSTKVDKDTFFVGQRVLYGEFSGTRIIINDEELFIMTPDDISAIILATEKTDEKRTYSNNSLL